MKIYLVGGAVRDKLLGLPINERDWVVVGATPDELLQQKYRKVGRDFPVFLHPKTKEEYALARTERKAAPGYYGFSCTFSPTVTLAEDLARRDLTINAMAMDEQGNIIDPYEGQRDLDNKLLRHVSPAFVEDPVRVLRVARFAARFFHLGFRLADETRLLMYSMVHSGELYSLVAERVWKEWHRSLLEVNPAQFLKILRSCDALRIIIPELDALFGIPLEHPYHVIIDSGMYSLEILHKASVLSADSVIRFAALMHFLGNAQMPISCWPIRKTNSEYGVKIIESLCARLRIPNEYRQLAIMSTRYSLRIHQLNTLDATSIMATLDALDAFRRPQLFSSLLIVCQVLYSLDNEKYYLLTVRWNFILNECTKVDVNAIIAQGYQGIAIKNEMQQRRLACINLIINSWNIDEK